MASDSSSVGSGEPVPRCESCAKSASITPHTNDDPWRCSYDELHQGAANGCPRCSFVAACIATIERHLDGDRISSVKAFPWSNQFSVTNSRGEIYLDIFIENRETGNLHTPFEIQKIFSRLPDTTDSDATAKTMRAWLKECEEHHEDCELESGRESEFNGPLRLLDLQHGSVVLRENAGNVKYACLSHCWGTVTDEILKTTEQALKDFKIEVPEHRLPVNFLHAIKVCRSLGIDYLWIDSLCIIQDEKNGEDWNTQAAQMSDIYEHAYVTIAATRSADASGGCYLRRHPKYLAEPVPGYEGVFVLLYPSGLTGDDERSAIQSNQPLLERGWVYQEMRLSRRVFHFCDEQVIWVCKKSRLSESKCDGLAFSSMEHPEELRYTDMPHGLPSKSPRLLWYRWVHEYSRLKLTYPHKDRMAALAGLAKRMQNHHDMGRYFSGLWENSLELDLGWWTDHPPGDDSNEGQSNGSAEIPAYPSWSWASVHAPIEWDISMHWHVPLIEIQHIDFVADGPVHMGSVSKSSGSITVKARALDSSDLHPPADYDNTPTQVKGINMVFYRPDRSIKGGQTKMGGLILVTSIRSVRNGFASAIHVKLGNDGNIYERVGFVFLDYTSYGKNGGRTHIRENAIEPWESLPMMEVTIV